jgi:hypothetical protein
MNKNLQLCTIHLLALPFSWRLGIYNTIYINNLMTSRINIYLTDTVQFAVRVSAVGVRNPYASTLRIKSFLIVARPGASFEGHKYNWVRVDTLLLQAWLHKLLRMADQELTAAGVDVSPKMWVWSDTLLGRLLHIPKRRISVCNYVCRRQT